MNGNAVSERQETIVVSEGTNDRDFTVGTPSNNMANNENAMNLKTLEDVLISGLTGKRAISLIQLKTRYKMQF